MDRDALEGRRLAIPADSIETFVQASQILEEPLRILDIRGGRTLGEPIVDGLEPAVRFCTPVVIAQ